MIEKGDYAVIFTSVRHVDDKEYHNLNNELEELAKTYDSFIRMDSARSGLGISVSYWKDEESIKEFKQAARHQLAQKLGREKWYEMYEVSVAKIERHYGFKK